MIQKSEVILLRMAERNEMLTEPGARGQTDELQSRINFQPPKIKSRQYPQSKQFISYGDK